MFHAHWRRKDILIFGEERLCKCQLRPCGLMCHLRLILIFCLDDLSRAVNGVFISPTLIAFLSVSPFSSVSSYCMYFGDPWLGAYILRSVRTSWCSVPFILIKCPSFSLVTCVILKFILSNKSMATPAFLWMLFAWRIIFHPVTLSLPLSLWFKCVSWRQNMVGFFVCLFVFCCCCFDPVCHSVLL